MKRQHRMPFGAEVFDDGRVRFRLWAPSAKKIELCLRDGDGESRQTMIQEQCGWWGVITTLARPWSLYSYRIDDNLVVPDPASRFQPNDVHGPSQVIDPTRFEWRDEAWRGRPWHEAVIYEMHVGAFTLQGTFAAAAERLPYLVELGVTAVELMPVADFPGARNWGYDGVLPFAPDSRYGSPDDLKSFVQRAHELNLMVLLDVVYNHFGPEGNYLHAYAASFFTNRHHTPWGAAINYDGDDSAFVREFVINNALFWIDEYHIDGLRLDAIHAIVDDSEPDILAELAGRVRTRIGSDRFVHLVLENDNNAAHYMRGSSAGDKRVYDAQWNDDIHHAFHVLLTGERDGYYADYADRPLWHLGRCLTQGFAYQGEGSPYRGGERRGERSADLPPSAFVSFLQTHDQVGNRAYGERIHTLSDAQKLRAALAILLIAPSPPLLFMGEEFAAAQPFLFFCDFGGDLAEAVTQGRRREFARFAQFADPAAQQQIPDPSDAVTFARSVLDWSCLERDPHAAYLRLYRTLLAIRQREVVPLLARGVREGEFELREGGLLLAWWRVSDARTLRLCANMDDQSTASVEPAGRVIYASEPNVDEWRKRGVMSPWSVIWTIEQTGEGGR